MRANTELEHAAIVTSTILLSIFECVSWPAEVCVPSKSMAYLLKKLQKYIHVQKLTKSFLKTQNALKSLKFDLDSMMFQRQVRIFVSFNTSRNRGVLAIEIKGELGERLD